MIIFDFSQQYYMKWHTALLSFMVFFICNPAKTQTPETPVFKMVPLGVKGGLDESNLSAYMLSVNGTNEYICLDAGTVYTGVKKAVEAAVFNVPVDRVIRQYIKGYCISHGHLDHVAGLIINSPDDSAKNIYAMSYCLDVLMHNYFTWNSWANFADSGDQPLLKKYHYTVLSESKEIPLTNTAMQVRAFPLSHVKPHLSTAFLVRYENAYLLYLGDTGADSIEQSTRLRDLWKLIAPLIQSQQLKAICIETSFPDEQPVKSLFGHLTPRLLMKEMNELAAMAGVKAMKGLPVVITHMKPSGNNEARIKQELREQNTLQLKLVFPQQAVPILF
jgi:3',5'-cyclic-nucleotide phosphodiesterase